MDWENAAYRFGDSRSETVILALHGFLGCGQDFSLLKPWAGNVEWVCPNLPAIHPLKNIALWRQQSFLFHRRWLKKWLGALGDRRVIILGYSLGGRLVLNYLSGGKDLPGAAALIGAHPGLGGSSAGRQRYEEDCQRAGAIDLPGWETWLKEWSKQLIFKGQQRVEKNFLNCVQKRRVQLNPFVCGRALKALSTGRMREVKSVPTAIPLGLFPGEEDTKFLSLSLRMVKQWGHGDVQPIPYSGHACHWENPELFMRIFNQWLQQAGFIG